jgi:hypothetical protein
MVGGGAALALTGLLALAARPGAPPPGASAAPSASAVVAIGSVPAAGSAAPVITSEHGDPLIGSDGAVSANVPLFGPTPMATLEPAPLAPPTSPAQLTLEAAERAEASASVTAPPDDEEFVEERKPAAAESAQKLSKKAEKKPEDVAPWGRGKVVTPTIHRLRLDGAGDALQGSFQPTGFTVVVPNRKVMEQGNGIAKRDARIARVRTVNTPNGAQITFQFKDGVPAYRARLRRDYVEFLVGAPESKASGSTAKTTTASAKSKSK